MKQRTVSFNSIWYCLQPDKMLNQIAKPLILMGSVILLLVTFTGIASAQAAFLFGDQLTTSDIDSNDKFGETVAVSGDTMVIGAPHDDYLYSYDGSISIFEQNAAGEWVFITKKGASDGNYWRSFGGHVDIDDDTIVVGEQWSKPK